MANPVETPKGGCPENRPLQACFTRSALWAGAANAGLPIGVRVRRESVDLQAISGIHGAGELVRRARRKTRLAVGTTIDPAGVEARERKLGAVDLCPQAILRGA